VAADLSGAARFVDRAQEFDRLRALRKVTNASSRKIVRLQARHGRYDRFNERVVEEWVESTTASARVTEVLSETTAYAKVDAIADRVRASEPTTRKYLTEFVDEGIGMTEQDGRTTLYTRHEGHLVEGRIEELRRTHSRQELVDGLQRMSESIHAFRETYDVESPEDLAVELGPGEDGCGAVGRWRSTRRNPAIAKAAVQVDEAHRLAEA
jgi:hypothetical protein